VQEQTTSKLSLECRGCFGTVRSAKSSVAPTTRTRSTLS